MNNTYINKISIPEMFSDSNGKTSISATLGAYCIVNGVVYMGIGILGLFLNINGADNILLQSLALATLGSTMIVVKRLKPTKDTTNTDEIKLE